MRYLIFLLTISIVIEVPYYLLITSIINEVPYISLIHFDITGVLWNLIGYNQCDRRNLIGYNQCNRRVESHCLSITLQIQGELAIKPKDLRFIEFDGKTN